MDHETQPLDTKHKFLCPTRRGKDARGGPRGLFVGRGPLRMPLRPMPVPGPPMPGVLRMPGVPPMVGLIPVGRPSPPSPMPGVPLIPVVPMPGVPRGWRKRLVYIRPLTGRSPRRFLPCSFLCSPSHLVILSPHLSCIPQMTPFIPDFKLPRLVLRLDGRFSTF